MSDILCANCGGVAGTLTEYAWTDHGQDPPDDDIDDELVDDLGRVFCSEYCLKEANPPRCPECEDRVVDNEGDLCEICAEEKSEAA